MTWFSDVVSKIPVLFTKCPVLALLKLQLNCSNVTFVCGRNIAVCGCNRKTDLCAVEHEFNRIKLEGREILSFANYGNLVIQMLGSSVMPHRHYYLRVPMWCRIDITTYGYRCDSKIDTYLVLLHEFNGIQWNCCVKCNAQFMEAIHTFNTADYLFSRHDDSLGTKSNNFCFWFLSHENYLTLTFQIGLFDSRKLD